VGSINQSRSDFFQSGHAQNSPTKRPCDSYEAISLHIRQEDIMLIGHTLVASPNLANHSMFACAVGALGFVIRKTSGGSRIDEKFLERKVRSVPLVITVIAHEMDAWKIKLPATSGTPGHMENSWMIGIR
jgi:hypothetical protein